MSQASFNLDREKFLIFIPARRNSKGLPFKNRKLLMDTIEIIPNRYKKKVIVSTDDEEIIKVCLKFGIAVEKRNPQLSSDTASMRSVLQSFIANRMLSDTLIIMLYLTYPEREWKDVENAYNFFKTHNAKSLLCKKEAETHPYLTMIEDGTRGKQIVTHNLYRRQDYPPVFEISHFISIINPREINNLNENLYNKETRYFKIENVIDVDEKEDLQKFKEKPVTKKKVLILGNDKHLNNFDKSKLADDVITVGINRTWMKTETDFLFFVDGLILEELIKQNKDLKKMNLVASDWVLKNGKNKKILPYIADGTVKLYNRKTRRFPDSVTTSIEYFSQLFENQVTFYLYGVSLNYDKEENHFWTKTSDIIEPGVKWSSTRFAKIFNNFKMIRRKHNIVSLTPGSRLNTIFKFVPLETLYKK